MTEGNALLELVIRNEDDAWAALAAALEAPATTPTRPLRFEGWPCLALNVQGHDWHSTVPTRIMPALMDVQRDLYRAYATLRYDGPNLRRLRNDERDELEVVVKVDKGSSEFSSELWDHLTKLAQTAAERMNGTEVTIAVIGVALSIAAPVMWKAWLNARVKQRKAELKQQTVHEELAAKVELTKLENERFALMQKAATAQPVVAQAVDDAQATGNQFLKATRSGDTLVRGGVPVPANDAGVLVQADRERAREVELQGEFLVRGVRTDKGAGFRVEVQRVADGATFNVDVPMDLPFDQRQVIQQAEWSKGKVLLWIEAENLRGTIVRGEVLKAAAPKPVDQNASH